MTNGPVLSQHSWCSPTHPHTLPETNIFAPENRPSPKEPTIPTIHFQGQAVSFREGNRYPGKDPLTPPENS